MVWGWGRDLGGGQVSFVLRMEQVRDLDSEQVSFVPRMERVRGLDGWGMSSARHRMGWVSAVRTVV